MARGGKAAADETAGDEEAVTEPEDKTARGETAASEDVTASPLAAVCEMYLRDRLHDSSQLSGQSRRVG
jgi:hypothetical protein